MSRLHLDRLVVRDLRNIAQAELVPSERLNVIAGDNGHGKTTLLEAIYFAATSRSFRTHRLGELVRHGAAAASVRARFLERGTELAPVVREQTAAIQASRAVVGIDGNRSTNLAEFATRSPVVIFHPEELALSAGPAPLRRTLLDRLALFMDPLSADHRSRYTRALRARQELLRRGFVEGSTEARTIDAFEELCAAHGARLTAARKAAAEALMPELASAFRHIAASEITLSVRFVPGGDSDSAAAREQLARRRREDARRLSAAFGPHRDELLFLIDGHPARVVASQGQHRALTLAVKAAEAATVAAVRGVEPILLLDDVSSELDPDRTSALFTFLGLTRGQIFLTTTRPELIQTPWVSASERRDFRVVAGELVGLL
jgi:DNA replication and repair protein RecF